MRLFDTHAHLDLGPYSDPETRRSAVDRAKSAGIAAILIPGVNPETWLDLLALAERLRREVPGVCIHTGLGVHPRLLADTPDAHDAQIAPRLEHLLSLAPSGLVAIGECGLDFGRRGATVDRARQLRVFDLHLHLARRHGLPLLLHCVDAHAVTAERLLAAPTPPSILHSFSGSPELAHQLVRAGHYIALAGALTRPGARRPRDVARAIPSDRLLLETDSPDQTPHSQRPAACEPAFLREIAEAVAEARGVALAELAAATTANAARVLALDPHTLCP
jgi:TatD DNase family protein